jgi:hypothetical protein
MADLGMLALAALALNALRDKPAASVPPPPKEPDPPAGPDTGKLAGELGGLAGTALTAILGAVGGGGGGGSAIAGGGTAAITTGAATGGAGAGASAGTVGGAFAVGGITAGGAFAFAWAAFFVAQFVVINLVNSARIGWLRYRSSVLELNSNPLRHLHKLELELVRSTCAYLRLPPPAEVDADDSALEGSTWAASHPGEAGEDPRLGKVTVTAEDGQQGTHLFRAWRTLMGNPFTGKSAYANWRFLQMAARLVASRYVFDLAKFARGLMRGMPNLGGVNLPDWDAATVNSVWSYPLVGGGQPDKTYAAFHQEMLELERGLPAGQHYSVDDLLNGAHLAALLHAASKVSGDTGIYSPWDPALYARWLYNALGLAATREHATLQGHLIMLDPVFYKVPAQNLWLDVDNLKAGKPARPFLLTDPALVPTPAGETSLAVRP